MRNATGVLIAAGLLATGAAANDWPSWRGPTGDGRSTETGLPTSWSDSEGVTWKTPMPTWSGSSPIVWGDRVFVSTAEGGVRTEGRRGRRGGGAPGDQPPPKPEPTPEPDPDADRLSLWAIDRATGEVMWTRSLGGGNEQMQKHNMSSPSPVTDGKSVWALTGTGVLEAFDFEGNELWGRDLQAEYGDFGLNWGYASSPALHQGVLYVQVLHGMKTDDPSYVLAVNASDGSTLWRVERPTDAPRESPDAYTTPAVLERGGRTAIVVSGGDYVTGHDPATGEELWRLGGLNPEKNGNYRVVASAVIGGDMLFVPTRKEPFQAFRLGAAHAAPELAWTTREGPDVPTPVTDGERLYVVKDNGVMLALDPGSGDVVWGPQRLEVGTYSASPVLADGRIYVTNEAGLTSVVSAGPEFELLAENDLAAYTLSSPAVSDGQIFIRTERFLYCIGERRQ